MNKCPVEWMTLSTLSDKCCLIENTIRSIASSIVIVFILFNSVIKQHLWNNEYFNWTLILQKIWFILKDCMKTRFWCSKYFNDFFGKYTKYSQHEVFCFQNISHQLECLLLMGPRPKKTYSRFYLRDNRWLENFRY